MMVVLYGNEYMYVITVIVMMNIYILYIKCHLNYIKMNNHIPGKCFILGSKQLKKNFFQAETIWQQVQNIIGKKFRGQKHPSKAKCIDILQG